MQPVGHLINYKIYVAETGTTLKCDHRTVAVLGNSGPIVSPVPLPMPLQQRHVDEIQCAQGVITAISLGRGYDRNASRPNEDAALAAVITDPRTGRRFHFAAVADGAGSHVGQRVERASRLAVHIAHKLLSDAVADGDDTIRAPLCALQQPGSDRTAALGELRRVLLPRLGNRFAAQVSCDYYNMLGAGLELPDNFKNPRFESAYATTLRLAISGPCGAFVLAIGDGGTAVVDPESQTAHLDGFVDDGSPTAGLSINKAALMASDASVKNYAPLQSDIMSSAKCVSAEAGVVILATDGVGLAFGCRPAADTVAAIVRAGPTALAPMLTDGGDDATVVVMPPPAGPRRDPAPTHPVNGAKRRTAPLAGS